MNTGLGNVSDSEMQAERACDSEDESEFVKSSDEENLVNEEQMCVTYTGRRRRMKVSLWMKLKSSVMNTARTLRLFARSVLTGGIYGLDCYPLYVTAVYVTAPNVCYFAEIE